MIRFSRLSHQILIVFITLVILSLAGLGWVMTWLAQDIVTNNILQGHRVLAQRIADEINLEMQDVRPIISLLAESAPIQSLDPTEVTATLSLYQARFPQFTALFVTDASGMQIARTDEQPLENIAHTYGFQVAQQGNELVSDVYLSGKDQEPTLTIYQPIIKSSPDRDAQVAGVLIAEVNFSRLQRLLEFLTLPADETAVIFARNGQAIAHSQLAESVDLPALTDPALIEQLVLAPAGVLDRYVDELGREVVGVHAPVEGLGWGVVIQTPLRKLDEEIATLRRTMLIGLLAGIALAVIAGWLMARHLTQPIEQLVGATEQVASGDLSVSVYVSTSNELGRLAGAFNRMVVNVRQAQEQLRRNESRLGELVEQRTAELQTTNQKLAQELAEHTETEAALIRALDLTEILYVASRTLINIESLPDLLQSVVDNIAEALPAYRVTLITLDMENREITHIATGGADIDQAADISFAELWDGLSGWVLRELKPALSPQGEPDPRESLPVQQRRIETNCGSVLVVPLQYRRKVFGTITACNRPEERDFDQTDVGIMVSLANQAAVAIENASLYQETLKSATELAALYEIEKRITSTLELDKLLQTIAENAVRLIGADKCIIMLIDVQKSELIKVMGYGYTPSQLQNHTYEEFLDGISGWVLQHKKPTLSTDIKTDPRNRGKALAKAQRSKSKSVAVSPLIINDEVIGTLTVVNGKQKRIFTDNDLNLVTMLAGQAAIAIHNGRLYEAAQEADRLKSAFLATMSHELRTPLNSIIGFTGIMLQGLAGPLNDEQTLQLGMVSKSAQHLLDLINDVLDISKIEAGQLKIAREPVDLSQTIDKVVQTVMPLAQEKKLLLQVSIAPDVGQITSDERRVEQIIINLVNNAIKFTDQGEVGITCNLKNGEVLTRVSDTGTGIKPEDVDKLFKPFRQLDVGVARKREGTGLGLSICRRLVEMLGGKIWVESEWGKGSVFSFTLPAHRPKPDQE